MDPTIWPDVVNSEFRIFGKPVRALSQGELLLAYGVPPGVLMYGVTFRYTVRAEILERAATGQLENPIPAEFAELLMECARVE